MPDNYGSHSGPKSPLGVLLPKKPAILLPPSVRDHNADGERGYILPPAELSLPNQEQIGELANQTAESNFQRRISHDLSKLVINQLDLSGLGYQSLIDLVANNLDGAIILLRAINKIGEADPLYAIYQTAKLDLLLILTNNLKSIQNQLFWWDDYDKKAIRDSSLLIPYQGEFIDYLVNDLSLLIETHSSSDQQKAIYDILLQLDLSTEYCEKLWNLMEDSKVLSLHPLGLNLFWELWSLPEFQSYYTDLLNRVYEEFDLIESSDYNNLAKMVRELDLPMPIIPTQAVRLGVEVEHIPSNWHRTNPQNPLLGSAIGRFEIGEDREGFPEYRTQNKETVQNYAAGLGRYQLDLHKLSLLLIARANDNKDTHTIHLHFDSEQSKNPPGFGFLSFRSGRKNKRTWEVLDFIPPFSDNWLKTGDLIALIEVLATRANYNWTLPKLVISDSDVDLYKQDPQLATKQILFRFFASVLPDKRQLFALVHLMERTRVFEFVNLSAIYKYIGSQSSAAVDELVSLFLANLIEAGQLNLLTYFSDELPISIFERTFQQIRIDFDPKKSGAVAFLLDKLKLQKSTVLKSLEGYFEENSISTVGFNTRQKELFIVLASLLPDKIHKIIKDFDTEALIHLLFTLHSYTLDSLVERFNSSFSWNKVHPHSTGLRFTSSKLIADTLERTMPINVCKDYSTDTQRVLEFLAKSGKQQIVYNAIFGSQVIDPFYWCTKSIVDYLAKDSITSKSLITLIWSRKKELIEYLKTDVGAAAFLEIYVIWGKTNPNQLVSFLTWLNSGADTNQEYQEYSLELFKDSVVEVVPELANLSHLSDISASIHIGLYFPNLRRKY